MFIELIDFPKPKLSPKTCNSSAVLRLTFEGNKLAEILNLPCIKNMADGWKHLLKKKKASSALHLAMLGIPNDESLLKICVRRKDPLWTKLEVSLVFSKWRKGWNTNVQTSSFSLWASVLPKDLCQCRRWILSLQIAASWATNSCEWFMLTRKPKLPDRFPSQHVKIIRSWIRKVYCPE